MSEIDEIKARLDIIELISESVNLHRSGKNFAGYCPFHANSRTPAFYVFPDTGTWHCFGCHEGGDIFGFVMKKEGLDFKDTVQRLAERAGVELRSRTPKDAEKEETFEALRALLEEAVTFFRHQLWNTAAGKTALEYLRQRNLTDDTIESFGIGYAPHSWDMLINHFTAIQITPKNLLDVGLAGERESGGIYDRFRHRVMFPIRDERGRITGFGARCLNPDDMPKYLNSPQTVLFDKGRLLYGLDKARKPIRVQDQAVIVEGYLDVIALHQYGFTNVVSPMGTALNEHQLRVLKTLSRRIVLALDADAAGDRATLRGLEIARQTLDREDEILFDARGLLQHEARLQADIRVAVLPKGMDPDEVVHRNPDEWKKILENARPIVIHVMDTLAANRDLNDPKQKDEVARQVLPLIEDVPSSIERETYRQRLARLLHVDERAFVNIRAYSHRSASARRASTGKPSSDKQQTGINFISVPNYEREAHILGILLRDPSLLFRIDRALQEEKLDRFAEQDFLRSDYQQIFTILHFSLEQDEIEPYKYIQNKLSSLLLEVADDLYARTEKVVLEDERIVDDIFRTLLYLRRNNFQRQKDVLDNQLSEAQEQGSEEVLEELKVQLHETLKIIYRCDLARQRLVHFG